MEARRPAVRIIRDPRDAERAARDWMVYFGFTDARMTVVGPDIGVDVEAKEAVAQVKSGVAPTGRPVIQQIYGIAELEDKEPFLFTVGGVTDEAREWADRAEVAIFQLDLSGDARPLNNHAREVMKQAAGTISGWDAVEAELEIQLSEGEEASITAEFTAPGGFHGFWGIWVYADGLMQVTRDLAGASRKRVDCVRDAVDWVSEALDSLRATYWDSRPFLTVSGSVRRFVPRISYPVAPVASRPPPPQASGLPLVSEPPVLRVSASDIYGLLAGPGCDRRVFLQAHGIAGSDPSALQVMLMEIGLEHEDRHRLRFPNLLDLSEGSLEQRSQATAAALDSGDRGLYQGVLIAQVELQDGETASAVGVPDFMLPTGSAHVIRDTKTAVRVQPDERPDIAAQLRFYAFLYERNVGTAPDRLEVLAGDGSVYEIPYEGQESVTPLIERVAHLKSTSREPRCDVKWSHRSSCPYFEHCWTQAVGRMQVSTVPGLTRSAVGVLRGQGVESIPDLLEQHDVQSLAEVVVPRGDKRQRIGRRSEAIIRSAVSLRDRETIVHGPLDLPAADSVVLLDLEGTPTLGGHAGYIYLWGTAVHGRHPLPYDAAFALGGGEINDGEGWDRFLDRASRIMTEHGDVPWIHWASYERTQIRAYIQRFGDPEGVGGRVLDLLVDLLQIVKRSVTFPVHSYSLKAVEQFVGFHRTQGQFGGDWSIAIWQEAIDAAAPEQRMRLLEELATYNREDLEGMAAVYDYLVKLETGD